VTDSRFDSGFRIQDSRFGIRDSRFEIRDPSSEIRDPRSEIRDPKIGGTEQESYVTRGKSGRSSSRSSHYRWEKTKRAQRSDFTTLSRECRRSPSLSRSFSVFLPPVLSLFSFRGVPPLLPRHTVRPSVRRVPPALFF